MLKYGDKIGIVCCSNGQKGTYTEKIKYLENTLIAIGLHPVFSDHIYEKESIFSGTAQERANADKPSRSFPLAVKAGTIDQYGISIMV